MSEYQYVHFLALDRPLDDDQLAYMRTQSTRAEISRWEFVNEYHFGDFHGNPNKMLLRGYDVHLHYANFGIRRLMFRLPGGLPWQKKIFEAYLPESGVEWHPDKRGPGGVLEVFPQADADTFIEEPFEIEEILPQIAEVRRLLVAGDLRPLYLLWLMMCSIHGDDESREPPLPAGMDSLPDCLAELCDFYELDADLIQVAAEGSPPLPDPKLIDTHLAAWLDRQSKDDLRQLAQRLLAEQSDSVRTETLALIRKESGTADWPTVTLNRTVGELLALSEQPKMHRLQEIAEATEKARRKHLKELADTPEAVIAWVRKLVAKRSKSNYIEAVAALVDLREALGPNDGPARVALEAERLRKSNPTLRTLIAELRAHGMLDGAK